MTLDFALTLLGLVIKGHCHQASELSMKEKRVGGLSWCIGYGSSWGGRVITGNTAEKNE